MHRGLLRHARCLVAGAVAAGVLVGVTHSVVASAEPGQPGAVVVDAQSAPDEGSAKAVASGYGHDVVVESSVTETTQVVAQPDGQLRLDESAEPVRVHRGSGWIAVDTDLAPVGGMLVPEAAAVNLIDKVSPIGNVRFGSMPQPHTR